MSEETEVSPYHAEMLYLAVNAAAVKQQLSPTNKTFDVLLAQWWKITHKTLIHLSKFLTQKLKKYVFLQCLKIAKNVFFAFFNFGNFHQFLSN